MLIEKTEYTLRPWQSGDASSLAKYMNNIYIWNNLRDALPSPYTLSDADFYINQAMAKDYIQDAAIVIDGFAVGGIGIVPGVDVERISAELGYWLGEPYWKKGIMTYVVKNFCNYVFSDTSITRLFATPFAFNKGSQRVLEKSGFRKVGVLHRCAIKNNRIEDMVYYELIK